MGEREGGGKGGGRRRGGRKGRGGSKTATAGRVKEDEYYSDEEEEFNSVSPSPSPPASPSETLVINESSSRFRNRPRPGREPAEKRAGRAGKSKPTTGTTGTINTKDLPQAYLNTSGTLGPTTSLRRRSKAKSTSSALPSNTHAPPFSNSTNPPVTMEAFNKTQGAAPLDVATLRFLEKSATLVSDATGRSRGRILEETFGGEGVQEGAGGREREQRRRRSEAATGRPSTSQSSATGRVLEGAASSAWLPRAAEPSSVVAAAAASTLPAVNARKHPPSSAFGGKSRSPPSRAAPSSSSPSKSTAGTRPRPRTSAPSSTAPSTAATALAQAEALGAKLLGPLTLTTCADTTLPPKPPLPSSLPSNEWENELAKNILSLYGNQVVEEIKAKREEVEEAKEARVRRQEGRVGEGGEGRRGGRGGRRGEGEEKKMAKWGGGTKVEKDKEAKDKADKAAKTEASKLIVMPVRPKPIWFGGTGAVQAEWSALEEFLGGGLGNSQGVPSVRKNLEALQEKGTYSAYSQYIATVEGLLSAGMRGQMDTQTTQLMERLWRQMVVTCNAFGVRCLEQKKYASALSLLEKANDLAGYEDVIPHHLVQELKAFVSDSFSYYYMRRNKPSASLQYITAAMKAHTKRRDYPHMAKCLLHTSCILSKLERHEESTRCLQQVLGMVDDGHLDVGSNNAQHLLLVSVAYHNTAVSQLITRQVTSACSSSQNARRLSLLCLSHSSRYLPTFEATHAAALGELAASVRLKQDRTEHEVFKKLAEGMYE